MQLIVFRFTFLRSLKFFLRGQPNSVTRLLTSRPVPASRRYRAEERGGDGGLRMRDPFLRAFSGNDTTAESHSADSWLNRVRENLGQLLIPSHFKPSSANGAPIHLLKFDKSLRPARAQGVSLITHGAVFAALLFLLAHGPGGTA